MIRNGCLPVLLLTLLWPAVALAEPKDDARRYFISALEAAEAGDYQAAVERFLAAQEAFPHPATMFNIARGYEDLGQPDTALTWYRDFASAYPERAGEVEDDIRRLEASRQSAAASPTDAGRGAVRPADAEDLGALEDLAQQLQTLVETMRERAVQDVADQPSQTDPQSAAPTTTQPADDSERGFRTDAYERVVYTASRYGQDPLDSPSTVTVLTAEDIRLSGATNIPDLLRRVAGVDVMSLTSAAPQVGIRGFNSEISNKVLWLVDGRSIYWDILAAPLPLNWPFSLEEIERIEVIRGPGSAIYGANAFSGVVNIITRNPGEGPRLLGKISTGHPAYTEATAVASGTVDRLSYRISAGYAQEGRWAKEQRLEDSSSYERFLDSEQGGGLFNTGDLAGRKVRANARLDQRFLDKGLVSISGGYTQGFTEFYNIGVLGNYILSGRTHYLRGDISYGPVHIRSFWNQEHARTGPWLSPVGEARDLDSPVHNDVVDVEAEGDLSFITGPVKHRLNIGAGYRYKSFAFGYLRGGFDNPIIEHHFQGFLQENLSWEWLTLVAAIRIDRHPLLPIGKTISPRGALIFRVAPTTSIRVNAGTAYRAMNATESYMDFNLPTSADGYYVRDYGGQTNPNDPLLDPERIVSVEIGAHDASTPFHEADIAVYYNRVSDLIGLTSISPSLSPYDPDGPGFRVGDSGWTNFSDVTYDAVGGELDLKVFPVDGLDILANMTIQQTFERTPASTVVDGSTSLVKFNLGASYRAPFRTDFSLMGHYVSPQTWRLREFNGAGQLVLNPQDVPSRFILSARVAGRPIKNRDLELAITLWNPTGFFGGFLEHPKGQPVGARLFGSVSMGF